MEDKIIVKKMLRCSLSFLQARNMQVPEYKLLQI